MVEVFDSESSLVVCWRLKGDEAKEGAGDRDSEEQGEGEGEGGEMECIGWKADVW